MFESWIMQPHAKTIHVKLISKPVQLFRNTQHRDLSHIASNQSTGRDKSEFSSCAVEGWCHASPLKLEYEGSVCLSGHITRGRQWWPASGVQLEPLIPPCNPPSDSYSSLMLSETAISLTRALWASTWKQSFLLHHVHPSICCHVKILLMLLHH